jgi:hypothetical protein
VALDGVVERWVTVERKVALPPPPWRAREVQVSSPLLGRRPLSLPPLISILVHCARCRVSWHADNGALLELTEDVEIWKAMSEYAVAPVSSGDSGGSSLKRDGGGARRRQGVHGGRGDEASLLEAVDALPLLPSPRMPHCSNYATVETLPLLDGGPRRFGNNVYLDRRQ